MAGATLFRRLLLAALVLAAPGRAGGDKRVPLGGTTLRRETPSTRAVLKLRRVELDEAAREPLGRRVEVREGPRSLVRRVEIDAPAQNGRFVRTTRTLTLEAKGTGPAPWANAGEHPSWSRRDAPTLASSKKLGPLYEPGRVRVRLFAPHAGTATLVLDQSGERVAMRPDRSGVWEGALERAPETLYGQRYHFEVDGRPASDPYAQSTAGDYGPSRFVDLRYGWTDQGFRAPKLRDLVISEAHVKDMTAHPSAPVPAADRGTYRGLAAPAITDHYQKLGVGAVELLPVQEYDDASGDHGTRNHWGYMTTHYFAPERRYASSPGPGTAAGAGGDEAAPRELQGAVDAFHRAGRAVIMDVVYNHTATGPGLHFLMLDRDYYFRLGPGGRLADGAATGNELATERPMVRKLIVDSLRHFVDAYHVDGFRFDLGALLDKRTISAIDRGLPRRIFLVAEPWAADARRARWGKGDLAGTRFAVWNDDFRNAANDFLSGAGDRNRLMTAIAGSAAPYGFTQRPQESVNYLESHDELTVADRTGGDPRRALLGATLLLTSQGVPMLGHGQEMLRSKRGIANAHNRDDEVSWIDWRLEDRNRAVVEATSKLVALRARYPHFRYDHPLGPSDIQWLLPPNPHALGYLLRPPPGSLGRAAQPDLLVLLNGDRQAWASFDLPRTGDWRVLMNGDRVDEEGRLGTAAGSYRVPPGAAVILAQARPAQPATAAADGRDAPSRPVAAPAAARPPGGR